jgi:hypothetical protein
MGEGTPHKTPFPWQTIQVKMRRWRQDLPKHWQKQAEGKKKKENSLWNLCKSTYTIVKQL